MNWALGTGKKGNDFHAPIFYISTSFFVFRQKNAYTFNTKKRKKMWKSLKKTNKQRGIKRKKNSVRKTRHSDQLLQLGFFPKLNNSTTNTSIPKKQQGAQGLVQLVGQCVCFSYNWSGFDYWDQTVRKKFLVNPLVPMWMNYLCPNREGDQLRYA